MHTFRFSVKCKLDCTGTKHFLLQQSIFNLSLLFSHTRMMEIHLCTDDMPVTILESFLNAEAAIEKKFECRERKFLPADFKSIKIYKEGY